MATPAQLEANRLNALKSTGPSPAGLARTRFNALKSGIDAKSLVIPGEDPAELEALSANYRLRFKPGCPVEQFLVDVLIHADWKLRRLRKREAQLLSPAPGETVNEAQVYRLDRQINAAERSYFRALKELPIQFAARIESEITGEIAELEAASRVPHSLPQPNPVPAPTPAAELEIGFVPANAPSQPNALAAKPSPVPPAASKPQKPARWDNPALRL